MKYKQARQDLDWCGYFIRVLSGKVFNFIELCGETPNRCPLEGHQHGGLKVTETSVMSFANETKCYYSGAPAN